MYFGMDHECLYYGGTVHRTRGPVRYGMLEVNPPDAAQPRASLQAAGMFRGFAVGFVFDNNNNNK